mgnify:CR=1 FL=1
MRKTDALSVITSKLGPLVLVFGAYLIAFGHVSPGGGFQGGVVLASGVLLLAIGRGTDDVSALLTPRLLARVEATAFALLLIVGLAGMLAGKGFFGNFLASRDGSGARVGFIIALNLLIGIKVGAGVAYLCLTLLKDADR